MRDLFFLEYEYVYQDYGLTICRLNYLSNACTGAFKLEKLALKNIYHESKILFFLLFYICTWLIISDSSITEIYQFCVHLLWYTKCYVGH